MPKNQHNITSYEYQYISALSAIYQNGYADGINERTGKSTKRLPGIVFRVDVGNEFPILKSKQVFGKTALREILWIWQKQSNNIHDLNAKIWDEWADASGCIGKAYGAQMRRPVTINTDPVHHAGRRTYANQAEYILEYLREFPHGRWGVATLWNPADLSKMNLVPCCHTSTWNLDGGRLNCVLDQRSGNMPYGVPFNTTQYAELMILFARDLGVEPGILTHVIADAHIYDNQMDGVKHQLDNYKLLNAVDLETIQLQYQLHDFIKTYDLDTTPETLHKHIKDILHCRPTFNVHSYVTNFFDVDEQACSIDDYGHMGKIDFGEIAV